MINTWLSSCPQSVTPGSMARTASSGAGSVQGDQIVTRTRGHVLMIVSWDGRDGDALKV